MAASAILFGIGVSDKIARCEIDLQKMEDVPVDMEGAYLIFKWTQRKMHLPGRWFELWWENKLFCFIPKDKDFLRFELPLEITQGKE